MAAENYCARLDQNGIVVEVIVCDDVEWARQTHSGTWVDCGETLPAVGDAWSP